MSERLDNEWMEYRYFIDVVLKDNCFIKNYIMLENINNKKLGYKEGFEKGKLEGRIEGIKKGYRLAVIECKK